MTTKPAIGPPVTGQPRRVYHVATPAAGAGANTAPVLVLTYACSGSAQLQSLLGRQPDLACTAGTGILQLCEQAAATWRVADGQASGAPLLPLAAASIRNLTAVIMASVLSSDGKRRWCETSSARPAYAESFLQLFPRTQVLCLHRSCPDVIKAILQANPWGLAGGTFSPFTAAYPASTAAALTAYWTACTEQLVAFEHAHRGSCLRVRYEDLAATDSGGGLFAFLGLDPPPRGASGSSGISTLPADDPQAPFPAAQIPARLLDRANSMMRELGYPFLRPAATAAPNTDSKVSRSFE